jgi:ubiquinone/menaquinone biosynthesis C-methylase UbiE
MHRHQHEHQDQKAYLPAMGTDRLLPLYDVVARLAGAPRVYRAVIDAADLRPGLRVLDVGCGTGSLLAAAARRASGLDITGLDPDPRVLRRARRKLARAGATARLDQGYAQELPYADGAFDLVLSSLMLHHLGDGAKEGMLAEVRRVLAPGGVLLLADLTGPMHGHGLLRRRHRHGPRPEFAASIPDLLRDAGLREVTEVGRVQARVGSVGLFRAVGG